MEDALEFSSWQGIVLLVTFLLTTTICAFSVTIPFPIPKCFRSLVSRLLICTRVRHEHRNITNDTDVGEKYIEDHDTEERNQVLYWHRLPIDFVTLPPATVLLLLAMGVLRPEDIRTGITGSGGVRPLDIMALFLSLAYLSISLDATGLFRFLALWVARKGGKSGRKLYLYLYAFFFVSGILVGNDPVILFGTPFLAYFSQVTGIVPPTAWILGQFAVANIASAVLPPSNQTNLVLSEAFGITFVKYPAYTVLPTVAAAIAVYILLAFVLFPSGEQIPETIDTGALDRCPSPIITGDGVLLRVSGESSYAINDKHGAIIGASLFAVTLILLLGLSPINVPVWEITVPPAIVMFVRDLWHDWKHMKGPVSESTERERDVAEHKTLVSIFRSCKQRLPTVSTVISRLPFSCVLFALCMFILVEGLTTHGWVEVFAGWWAAWIRACLKAGVASAVVGATMMMLLLSILLCNVCGTNIGAAILLARVLESWLSSDPSFDDASNGDARMIRFGSIFALALGTDFGAVSFSFSASLAGLLWHNILEQKGVKMEQRKFAVMNTPIVLVAAGVAGLVLVAELYVAVR